MHRTLSQLRNSTPLHLLLLMLFALVLNREGTFVPSGNENVYLLYLVKAWHPSFLATDFTFQESTAGHQVFNVLFGWPTLFLPLNIVGWIGRLGSWFLCFIALLRIGRHFRIPQWMISAGILLWLVQRQSFLGNEWIIGTFEAKCISYACLLFAIDQILDGKIILPAILTGLSFSFHTAVGLWGGAAIALAFASMNPIRSTLKFAIWAFLFALPGVITSLPLIFGSHPIAPEEARSMVTIEVPFHLDPFVFGPAKIAVMYLMLLFNILHYTTNREDRALRFLIRFQIALGAFFAFGVLCRFLGLFSLVQLFPFRVFAVLNMLFFFWHLAAAYTHRRDHPPTPALIALGLFTFFCLPSPVARLQGLATDQLPKWKHPHDDFLLAAQWVRENTPANTEVIAPPWRKDSFYELQRPLIADWHAPRYDAMTEWRQRIQSLVGDVSHMTVEDNLAGEMDDRAHRYYAALSDADIADIRKRYGGDLLISPSQYGYTVLFMTPTFRVYKLP